MSTHAAKAVPLLLMQRLLAAALTSIVLIGPKELFIECFVQNAFSLVVSPQPMRVLPLKLELIAADEFAPLVETGLRPGIQGNGFYLMGVFSVPVFGFRLDKGQSNFEN